jgi:hypothetical protein
MTMPPYTTDAGPDWDITPTPAQRRHLANLVAGVQARLSARRTHEPELTWTSDPAGWRSRVIAVGGCLRPIHLDGSWRIEHRESGDTLAQRSGPVLAPCGNRRASVCPACADRYAADAFHLIRAGLSGGKAIPATVAGKPRLFVTLTAPGFGPVHTRRTTPTGKRIPCRCGAHHLPADTRLGAPLDPRHYDYDGAVLWNAHAGELWHRFTVRLRRELATMAGIRVREFAGHARISYAKVAEYQRRGLIHFHAVIRLDGPDGPADPAPAWASAEALSAAVRAAATRTSLTRTMATRDGDTATQRFVWGEQVDVRTIHPADTARIEDEHGAISDTALAGYIAKYATKGTATSDGADRPIRSERDIDVLAVTPHHKAMIRTAWELGGLPGLGFVRHWAHMLGFRGHFLSKSQRYSVTFTELREQRAAWRHRELLDRYAITDEDIIVINDWRVTHQGYTTPEERELAEGIYERIRQHRTTQHEQEIAA